MIGAGTSLCAGAPSQQNILTEIFALDRPDHLTFHWDDFVRARSELDAFIEETFRPDSAVERNNVPLEDIFTVLDRALITRTMFQGKGEAHLARVRKSLAFAIIFMFDCKLREPRSAFYNTLAKYVVRRQTLSAALGNPVTFISLNWDIVLDNALFEHCGMASDAYSRCDFDYCCNVTPIRPVAEQPRTAVDMECCIKVHKMHGSFNWIICINCGRLLCEFGKKEGLLTYVEATRCLYCLEHNSLQSFFITPTLLKDLNNTHLQTVWHNAGLDLWQADRVAFVGYSFPLADFELRYLLKHSIKRDTEVVVALKEGTADFETSLQRYKMFFGRQLKQENVRGCGACSFFAQEFGFDFNESIDCKNSLV